MTHQMKIVIEGAVQAPSWTILEKMIKSVLNEPDALLIRISRDDNGVNYTARGDYTLGVRCSHSEDVEVKLQIS